MLIGFSQVEPQKMMFPPKQQIYIPKPMLNLHGGNILYLAEINFSL